MGPAAFDAEALPRSIARTRRQRARRPGILLDKDRGVFGAIARGLAGLFGHYRYGVEKAGGDQRLAQIVDHPAVVEFAAFEAGQSFDMVGIEGEIAGRTETTEARARPGRDRQGIDAILRFGIEQDVALADLGEGIAVLRQFDRHARFGPLDPRRHDRFADLQRKIVADKVFRFDRRSVDHDVRECVARAGDHIDHRGERLAGRIRRAVDPRRRTGFVPAFGRQQALHQGAVFGQPRGDLRNIGGLAVAVF